MENLDDEVIVKHMINQMIKKIEKCEIEDHTDFIEFKLDIYSSLIYLRTILEEKK